MLTASAAVPASPLVVKHRDTYSYARDHKHPLQAAYIRVVLRNPDATNKQIESTLKAAGLIKQLDPIRTTAARQFCGVSFTGSGATAKRVIDEEKFLAAAVALDVNDFTLLGAKKMLSPAPAPAPEPEVNKTKNTIDTIPALDLKSLVVLLKERMKEGNYTELHITENGVQFKRVQVTEGSLDL